MENQEEVRELSKEQLEQIKELLDNYFYSKEEQEQLNSQQNLVTLEQNADTQQLLQDIAINTQTSYHYSFIAIVLFGVVLASVLMYKFLKIFI